MKSIQWVPEVGSFHGHNLFWWWWGWLCLVKDTVKNKQTSFAVLSQLSSATGLPLLSILLAGDNVVFCCNEVEKS